MNPSSYQAPVNLVLLLQDLEFGGTQRYAIHVLRNLDRTLFSPQLWVLRGGMDMAAAAQETGAKVQWLSQSIKVGPKAIINLARKLLSDRPTVLYTLTPVPNIWGRVFGRLFGVPVVISSYRNIVTQQHEGLLWRLSSRIVCNAQVIKDTLVSRFAIDPHLISVVSNGVDTDFFSPERTLQASEPTVIWVGRLVEQKNPVMLLRGFKLVLRSVPQARLMIVGGGRLNPRVNDLVRSLDLESHVSLIPGTMDILPLLRRAWVFALPSSWEGSPNAIIEAMAVGLPVVATNVGGIPSLVNHGVTGLMCEARDHHAFAENLSRVLLDEPLRVFMGRKAREQVLAHHGVEIMVKGTQQVLREELALLDR